MKCFSYCDHKISLQTTTLYLINMRAKPEYPTYWFFKIWIFPTDSSNTQEINTSPKGQSNYKINLDWFNIISVRWRATNSMMIILVTVRPYDRMPDGSYARNSVHPVTEITGPSLKLFSSHSFWAVSVGTHKTGDTRCKLHRPVKYWHLEQAFTNSHSGLTCLHHLNAWYFFLLIDFLRFYKNIAMHWVGD